MADTAIAITAGSGTNIDTRTEATNSNHRQVVVLGDPSVNAGVAPVDVTLGLSVQVTAHVPGTGATSLGKAEDAVHTSGDVGVMALGVRTDSPAARAGTDGDYEPVQITGGRVASSIDGGCSTATLANVSTSTTSATLVASNSARRVAIVVNESSVVMYVKYGSTASATSYSYALQASETLKEDRYTGIITGTLASSTGTARVTELTV